MELSDNLREFSKEEKSSINNLFERESRRERILSTIQKEEEMLACNPPPPPVRKADSEVDLPRVAPLDVRYAADSARQNMHRWRT